MSVPVFPSLPGIIYPVKRSVKHLTLKQDAVSGRRTRYALQTYPTYGYEVGFSILRGAAALAEWQTLEAFYKSVYGPADLFQFNDPNDGVATAQQFGLGDGSTVGFQLTRSLGGFTEPTFLASPSAVYVNGSPTTNYTVGPAGFLTFGAAPASGYPLTWDGTYGWPCRFDDDSADFENFMFSYFELKSLKFSTEKL